MALTRANLELVSPKPSILVSSRKDYVGTLLANSNTITIGEEPLPTENILLFLNGICQNDFTIEENVITLPETLSENSEYRVVIGNILI